MRKLILALMALCALASAQIADIPSTTPGNAAFGIVNSNFTYTAARLVEFGTTLPSTCPSPYVFFKTDETPGENLYFCTATDTFTKMTTGGPPAWEYSAVSVGTRSVVNFIPGAGVTLVPVDTGTKIQWTFAVDSAVMLSRDQAQKNSDRYVALSTADNANYTGCPADHTMIVGSIVAGAELLVKMPAAANAAGAITLDICSTGTVNWKAHDGTTDPGAGAMAANRLYRIAHNGTVWVNAPVTAGGGGNVAGPGGAVVDSNAACWDGTSGTLLKDCGTTAGGGGSAANAFYSGTIDFPSITDGACNQQTFTATGLAAGSTLALSLPSGLNAGLFATALATAADTAAVRVCNFSGAAVDPASATFAVRALDSLGYLKGSGAIDFASIADGACLASTITVTGAATGNTVAPGWPAALDSGLTGAMFVSAANTVAVRVCNWSGAAVDPASLTYSAAITQ